MGTTNNTHSSIHKLQILFENEELVAINKPHNLLVHRTNLAKDATQFALQILRNQIGYRVYPAHRLDRKTSGVLLFSKSKASNRILQGLFRERKVKKCYLALVRGFVPGSGSIDYSLTECTKQVKAITHFSMFRQFEIPIPLGKFQTSRYSLVELNPETGRFHQLRKHMAHIFHPIIGDRPHGCNKQNKLWKERFHMDTMLLHAQRLEFQYPGYNSTKIEAPLSPEFESAIKILTKDHIA